MFESQLRGIATGSVCFLLVAACGRTSDNGENGNSERVQLGTSESALHNQPQLPIVANYALRLPTAVGVQGAAVVAGEKVSLGPRAKVAAQVINIGARGTELQPLAEAAAVLSESQIELAPRAVVRGNVVSPLAPRLRPGASIRGTDTRGSIGPFRDYAWTATYPVATGDVHVQPSADRTLAPGAYGEVEVAGSGILRLSAGTYYIREFTARPRSRIVADTSAGPVLVYVLHEAELREPIEGDGARLLLATLSNDELRLPAGFSGAVVAPNATIEIAPRSTVDGVLFGKKIEFGPGSNFTPKPFTAWEFLLPPVPKAECIIHFDATHNTAAFSYVNPLATQVTIPAGPRNLLSAGTTRSPLEVFESGTVARAQWIPFSTPQLTWAVGGLTAVADVATTPRCQGNDTPPAPVAVVVDRPTGTGASRTWRTYGSAPSAPGGPQFDTQTPIVPNTREGISYRNSVAFLQQPPVPIATGDAFTFRIYRQQLGSDAFCGPRRLYATNVRVNGVAFPDQFWQGCTNGVACGVVDPDIPLTTNVPQAQAQVAVSLDLWEADAGLCGGADDHILTLQLNVDRQSGALLAGSEVRVPDGDGGSNNTALTPNQDFVLGVDGFGIGWRNEGVGEQRAHICSAWNAQFLDAGPAVGVPEVEDFAGGGTGVQQVPAAFAFAELRVSGAAGTYAWSGVLDKEGCVPELYSPARKLFRQGAGLTDVQFKLQSAACFDPSGADCGRTTLTPTSGAVIATSLAGQANLFQLCSHWSSGPAPQVADCVNQIGLPGWVGGAPPAEIRLINPSQFEGTRIAAIASFLTAAEASGAGIGIAEAFITSTLGSGQQHRLELQANSAYCLKFSCAAYPACLEDYSCDTAAGSAAQGTPVKISGDFTKTDGRFVAGDSYVKYVVAHEIGHQIQDRAMGILQLSYAATPPTIVPPAKCACDHVGVANNLHCLQSIETSGASQVEGFAQFFAARVFNKASEPDATFKYYKEFLADTCPANATPDNCVTQAGTGLKIISPPYAVSAVEPVRWRNNNCFDNTVASTDAITTWGTEYDWMGFFYATNTQSAARSSMGDLFAVYKQACGGGRCSGREPDWGDLEAAAETRLSPVQRDFYRNGGRRFGVSRDVSR